ncbi:DNA-binding barrel domain superfamily [Sesbania bispinosa]|nr:DNA-binding barrel domain superfamily [Sesbania bispinosa]
MVGSTAILPMIRFFKIILKTNLERLKIPNMFTRRYGGNLSDPVFLKPPDGTGWKIELVKQNGEVWFGKGWEKFAQNYSLDHGYLVLFTYKGTCQFDVVILGKSALEIDYPLCNTFDQDQSVDDESVEILDELPNKDAEAGQKPFYSHKKMRGENEIEKATQRTSSLNWPRDARAQEVAEKFDSNNPFFTVCIKSIVLKKCRVSVPKLLQGYIEKKNEYVTLQIGKRSWNVKLLCRHGHTGHLSAGCGRGNGNAILPVRFFKIILKTNLQRLKIPNVFTRKYGGDLSNPVFVKPPDGTKWEIEWTKQNGTSQFDVLILNQSAVEIDYPLQDTFDDQSDDDKSIEILDEWPRQKAIHMRPLISPRPHKKMRGDKANQRTSSLNWPSNARAREVAENFVSNNPFFTIPIKAVHVAENPLYVPDLKGVVGSEDKYVMLQIGKRSWDVKLVGGPNGGRRFSAGWSVFAMESELQPGDVCVFELINTQDSIFKVHVYKRSS